MWRRHGRSPGPELVGDCEAFLAGHVVERIEERAAGEVPVWAWTNLLAHGNRGMLADAVSRPSRHRLLNRLWWIAQAQLADLILKMTDRVSLRDLQESVLIPLELELAARTDVPFWTARRWVNTVTAELHRHDHTPQSS